VEGEEIRFIRGYSWRDTSGDRRWEGSRGGKGSRNIGKNRRLMGRVGQVRRRAVGGNK